MTALRLLPLSPGTNRPCLTDWPNRASSDPLQWAEWQREFPRCNWGIRVGEGIGVLDLDTKGDPEGVGGIKTLIDIEEMLEIDLSYLPLVQSYSGAHLYFRYHGSLRSKVPWVPYIDVLADGGRQVAAPGTVREERGIERTYLLLRGSLDDIPYAPEVLVRAIRDWRSPRFGRQGGGGSATGSYDRLEPVQVYLEHGFGAQGGRDITCYRLACSLSRKHWNDPALVEAIIADAWRATPQGTHEFTWSEAKAKITQARAFVSREREAEAAFLRTFGGTE